MKELPCEERPYEKCLRNGAHNLSDKELLAVLLRCGTPGENVVDLAEKILYSSNEEGILSIHHYTLEHLLTLKGIGKVKAVQILCLSELAKRLAKASAKELLCFSSPDTIANYRQWECRPPQFVLS